MTDGSDWIKTPTRVVVTLEYIERYRRGLVTKDFWKWSGWTPVGAPSIHLLAAHAVDTDVAYAVGDDGVAIKTTDGGRDWDYVSTGVDVALLGVYFKDAQQGIVVGEEGTILLTEDGGANWHPPADWSGEENLVLRDVAFADSNQGFIVGAIQTHAMNMLAEENAIILRTLNGGDRWTKVLDGRLPGNEDADGLRAVSTPSANRVVTAGGYQRFIMGILETFSVALRSGDSGESWEYAVDFYPGHIFAIPLVDVSFYNDSLGFLVLGWPGLPLQKTDNGGDTWTRCSVPCLGNVMITSLELVDDQTIVAVGTSCGGAVVVRSDDGGEHWSVQDFGSFFDLRSVSFGSSQTGVAVGLGGTLEWSNDGGQSWERGEGPFAPRYNLR